MLPFNSTFFESPLGWIEIHTTEKGVSKLVFVDHPGLNIGTEDSIQIRTRLELEEYFEGKRKKFTLPVDLQGTAFRIKVWNELRSIPFGRTSTYGTIAFKFELNNGSRAVGAANGANPVSLIVPCHRVIGSNGKLTGYAGGIWRKKWLLAHERKITYGQLSLFD